MARGNVEQTNKKTQALSLRMADQSDRNRIYALRHQIYARELGQHSPNEQEQLTDSLDQFNEYIVAEREGELVGFVSITLSSAPRFSLDKYLPREQWQFPVDEGLFEVRLLTVIDAERSKPIAMLLMYAAWRYLQELAATRIVAIGRHEVIDLYQKIGFEPLGPSFQAGAVRYDLMSATMETATCRAGQFATRLRRFEPQLAWEMPFAFERAQDCNLQIEHETTACEHGGVFFRAIGEDFQTLERRHSIINADVLDAWFPPAPSVREVLTQHLDWILRTSPPTRCGGLIREIAAVRDVPEESLVLGAGSSDLIYRALSRWLAPESRVLLLDPTYGEYRHFFEQVVKCQVSSFSLSQADDFVVDLDRLSRQLEQNYDLVVLVNPNNPSGQFLSRQRLESLIQAAPVSTQFWIDEAYIDYVSASESLEKFAALSRNVVVCKSMSKAYALSGVRAGYLCGPQTLMEDLRTITPPWVVGLPAQIAGVLALRDHGYYQSRYVETHRLREHLTFELRDLGISVWSGAANFLLCRLPHEWGEVDSFIQRCRQRGLYLRDVSSMTVQPSVGLFRVAVKDAPTNIQIVEILREH